MRLVTNKSKNLLYRIVGANNVNVQFGTSYAVATQISADTDTTGLFKIVSYNGSSYEILSWIHDVFTRERVISTFTTPETTGYKHIVFGLNGAKIDTTCLCEINLKPSTTYTFSCNFTNITQGSISWKDMMLVEGSTAGEYEPYSYNLLDKWRYSPKTQTTINNVAFTNNGDGSWTVNGTATQKTAVNFFSDQTKLSKGDKICLSAPIDIESYGKIWYEISVQYTDGSSRYFSDVYPSVFSIANDVSMIYGYIVVGAGETVSGALLKPAIYDLTLMYGAGNEPTTVDQFYTDHPELKVSPLGFIELKNLEINNKNIKRLRYVTATRNLFDWSLLTGFYASIGGYQYKNIQLKPNTTYAISTTNSNYFNNVAGKKPYAKLITESNNELVFIGHQTNPALSIYPGHSATFTTDNTGKIGLAFHCPPFTEDAYKQFYEDWFANMQIEEGSTATSYVPYGYLDLGITPSNSGYLLNKYDNLSEELLEENIEKDTVNYHIPNKTNILLNKVEGNTKKVVQLLDKSKYPATTTKAGVTFTNNGNGSIVVNGTCTADTSFYVGRNVALKNGHQYLLFGAPIRGTWTTIIWTVDKLGSNDNPTGNRYTHKGDNTTSNCYIFVAKDFVADNLTFKPQIFDLTEMYGFGKEPTTVEQFKKDYPQFFDEKLDGIWNVRTSGISTTGKNLFVYNQIAKYDYNKDYKKYNANNVIFFKAGTYSITTTNVGSAVYVQAFSEPNIAITDIFSVLTPGDAVLMYEAWNGYAVNIQFKQSKVLQFTLSKDCYLTFCADPNVVTQPMIELGTVGTSYEPYQENKIDLLSTQELNGINGVNDYIEVIDKGNGLYDLKKTQNIDSVDLGTLDWAVDGSNFYISSISSVIKPPANNNSVGNYACQKYVNCAISKSFVDGDFGANSSGFVYFRNSAYTTVAAFKTAMNGVILYYQLKTPVTTTIAENLTYNQVSAIRTNGGLLLVNDNNNQKYAQPNVTITENYQYKI